MDWQEEPATQQQLLRLQECGYVATHALTITQAAALIRQYSKHLPHSASPQSAQATDAAAPAATGTSPGTSLLWRAPQVSESTKLHVYQLYQAVVAARRIVENNPERQGARADVRSAVGARHRFWVDTLRDQKPGPGACPATVELCQHFGARLFSPTWEQVKEVLDALDGAMPGWERDRPELFYETLKLNFPSLLRHK